MAVRQRGDSWQVSVTIKGVRKRKDCPTRAEAEAQEKEWLGQKVVAARVASTPHAGLPTPPSPRPFGEMAEAAYKMHWAKAKSARDKRTMVDRIVAWFGKDTPTHHWTTGKVREFFLYMTNERGVCGGTWNRNAATLSVILQMAEEDGALLVLPKLPRGKENPPRDRVLDPHEEALMLAGWGGDIEGRDIFCILIDTGLRPSELWSLEGSRVRLRQNELHLVQTKTDKPRRVPLTNRARALLTDRLEFHGLGLLFPGWRTDTYDKRFRRAKARTPLKDDATVTPYALRHTAGTRIGMAGAFAVREFLGHANVNTSQKYVHLAGEVLHTDAVLGKLNQAADLAAAAAMEKKG